MLVGYNAYFYLDKILKGRYIPVTPSMVQLEHVEIHFENLWKEQLLSKCCDLF